MAELNLLQEKILSDGVIRPGNVLKVDSFLNHQIDVPFISELGKEFKKLSDSVNAVPLFRNASSNSSNPVFIAFVSFLYLKTRCL